MPGRNASTISREAKRNTWLPSNENESYRPYRPKRLKPGPRTGRHCTAGPAQRKADRRRSTPRKPRRLSCERLRARVAGWLGRGRSQLLISGRLRMEYPESPCACARRPSTNGSIPARRSGNAGARCLPRGHKRHGRGVSRFALPNRVSIAERPQAAADRSGFGHWESDSVVGAGCNPHTEVERKTRFLVARIVPDKTADRSVGAQLAMPPAAGRRARQRHARQRRRVRPPPRA